MRTALTRFTAAAAVSLVMGSGVTPLAAQVGSAGQLELGGYGLLTSYLGRNPGLVQEFGAGGRLGFFFTNAFSLEASGDHTKTEQDLSGARMTVTRLAGTLFASRRVVGSTALYAGVGYERVFYRAGDDFDDNGVHLTIGNRLPLGGRAVLRVEGRGTYFPSSPRQSPGDRAFNLSASAGLSIFSFGGPPRDADRDGVKDGSDECPDTPLGATVDPRGCPSDGDLDGVFNGLDSCPDTPNGAHVDPVGCPYDEDHDDVFDGIDVCPGTPAGAVVDATGCPVDSDRDEVWDGLDQCPDTPQGATVDEVGCPGDDDGDGVWNGIDQCPNTPVDTAVDETGCPSDADGDGVANHLDLCPNSPPGSEVDEFGCPPQRDSDNDGVLDSRDRCPNTAPNQQVDAVGCPILFRVEESTGEVQPLILRGVNFETGKSTLTSASFAILDEVAASLLVHEEVRIEIAGHTDATGPMQLNMRLSLARAEAVRAYLAQKGVAIDRMVARGYGPDEPLATNSTVDGRALNRRVELRLRDQPSNR